MLRIHANTSAAGAKNYYTKADYFSQGQELVGVWRGKGAEMLGLSGDVQQKDWDALCDNRNPETGKRLATTPEVLAEETRMAYVVIARMLARHTKEGMSLCMKDSLMNGTTSAEKRFLRRSGFRA